MWYFSKRRSTAKEALSLLVLVVTAVFARLLGSFAALGRCRLVSLSARVRRGQFASGDDLVNSLREQKILAAIRRMLIPKALASVGEP